MLSMFVVFITLKLCNVIQWDWIFVCIPLFYFIGELVFALLILILFYKCFKKNYKENRSKMPDLSDSISKVQSFNDSLTNVMDNESKKEGTYEEKD